MCRVDLLKRTICFGVISDYQEIQRLIEPDTRTMAGDDLIATRKTICIFRSECVAGTKSVIGYRGVHMGITKQYSLRVTPYIRRIASSIVFSLSECNTC